MDAVRFEHTSIRIESLRPADEYAGTRVILPAHCGTARLRLQIDLGLGDSVWPQLQMRAYPSLLGFPAPSILTYPPEAVIAEKLEAIVVLGERNSRIKDFFDLKYLAGRFEFDRPTLVEAVRQTLVRRHTPIPVEEPVGLTTVYWENPSRSAQVRAFARRADLPVVADPGTEILEALRPFLLPVLDDLRLGIERPGTWKAGGPWQPESTDP